MDLLAALPPGSRIALIRLRSLGDSLLTTPALAALKRWRGDLRLGFVVEPVWAPVLEGNPDIDTIIPLPASLTGRWRGVAALRRFGAELAVNLHGGSTATLLTLASGARWQVGFAGQPYARLHRVAVPSAPPPPDRPRWHTVEHVASLFHHIGMPAASLGPLRIFPSAESRAAILQRLAACGVRPPFAYINATPRSPDMQWPAEYYREALSWLGREHGLAAVFARASGSPGVEERLVAALPPGRAALLVGTDVRDLIALEAESALVLGSDGGPIHIAAALAKPVVVLFGPSDAVVWHPWQTPCRVLQASLGAGLDSITVPQVTSAITTLLAAARRESASTSCH